MSASQCETFQAVKSDEDREGQMRDRLAAEIDEETEARL